MLSLPRLNQMIDFDDDYLLFPSQALWPSQRGGNQGRGGSRFGVPFTANNKYNLHLDLHHFEPQNISVKVDNGMINVNAKYEKDDEGHHVFREYSHMFSVPDNVVADQLKCKMSPKGVLQIDAPLKQEALQNAESGHNIPIEFVKK